MIDTDENNPSRLVYLDSKIDNQVESIVYKLNSEFSSTGSYVKTLFDDNKDNLNNFANNVVKFMNRTKVKKHTYTNGLNEKIQEKTYHPGTLFTFIRCFRGYYEITDTIDDNLMGYITVDKQTALDFFDSKKVTTEITLKSFKAMQDRLNKLNQEYTVKITSFD